MHTYPRLFRSATLLGLLSLGLLAPAVRAEDAKPAPAAPASAITPIYTQMETSEFITLTKATLEALAAGKKEAMVAKLTDLETAWDEKENALKPRDEKRWTTIDKTLDKAISALRSSKYNAPKGKAALELLIKEITESTKP
ncbi:MAG: hypothetical protein NTX20_07115 [Verrucomicrobia bacterium]|nr:hypothetical protein [Verrucomicrobiota bacterium]